MLRRNLKLEDNAFVSLEIDSKSSASQADTIHKAVGDMIFTVGMTNYVPFLLHWTADLDHGSTVKEIMCPQLVILMQNS
ncbi:hypothetical protein OUZ56_006391 [Daphnia magna]|uniref:Uncharacterized protein n=1 Tax=Daphnia magna TaxID=35525 RepID=A0ABQ9YVI2_9CRUS|nr:hypothetical protein OUZ56_006391 [Daphnia magna]